MLVLGLSSFFEFISLEVQEFRSVDNSRASLFMFSSPSNSPFPKGSTV